MNFGSFFDITKFGGVIAAGVLAAAIITLIQLSWSSGIKLAKLEVEHMQLSEETNKEFAKIHEKVDEKFAKVDEEFAKIHEKVDEKFAKVHEEFDNIAKILEGLQPLLEYVKELEQRVEKNENEIVGFEKTAEYLKGQVETILSNQ